MTQRFPPQAACGLATINWKTTAAPPNLIENSSVGKGSRHNYRNREKALPAEGRRRIRAAWTRGG